MPWTFDQFYFDEIGLELSHDGQRVKVDAQALRLLAVLLAHQHELVSKDTLMDEVWEGRQLGDNVISVCIAKLRKALGPEAGRTIVNAYGRGYRFSTLARKIDDVGGRARAPIDAPSAEHPATLVGREALQSRLERALQAAVAGHGSVCALLGEAGIGKTRLAEALAELALERSVGVAWGRCYDADETSALSPWVQIARTLGAVEPPAWASSSAATAGRDAWPRTQDWLSALCRDACAKRPQLFVLDDLQWADAASLALLTRLVRELSSLPLLIVLTVRDTDKPSSAASEARLHDVLGHRSCERMKLMRLSADEVARYVARETEQADPRLAPTVFAKSEGNPFFMVELVRAFRDDPSALPGGGLTVRGPALEIVRRSLRQIAEGAAHTLAMAATLGRTFELGVLAHALGRAPSDVLDDLDAALGAQLIVAAPDSATAFSFAHDLIRSVLYDDLMRRERATLHLRAAQALAATGGLGSDPISTGELARHMLNALPEGDANAAIEAARKAARSAQRVGAHADACAVLRRGLGALQFLPTSDPQAQAQLLLELARAERAQGDPEFIGHLMQAVQVAGQQRLGRVLADAGEIMSGGPGTMPMPGVGSTLEAARAALAEDDHIHRARVLAHLAVNVPYCRDTERANALLREASELAAPFAAANAVVLRQRIYYAGGPDNEAEAASLTRELAQLVASAPPEQRAWLMTAEFDRLLRSRQRGDTAESARLLDAFGHAARTFQHAELIWHHARIVAVLRLHEGEFEYARARFSELAEQADTIGLFGRMEIRAIDSAEFERQTALPLAGDVQPGDWLLVKPDDPPNVVGSKLRSLVYRGELDAAREGLAAVAPESLARLPQSRDYLATLCSLAFVSTQVSARAHAEALYPLLRPYPDYCALSVSFHQLGAVALQLGRLAHFLGDPSVAVTYLERALSIHERLGLLPLAAITRLDLARALGSAGGPEARVRAAASLEEARVLASRLGMRPLLHAIARG